MTLGSPRKGSESVSVVSAHTSSTAASSLSSEAVAAAIAKSRRKAQRAKKWRDATHGRASSPATFTSLSSQSVRSKSPLASPSPSTESASASTTSGSTSTPTISARKANLESKMARLRRSRQSPSPLTHPSQHQQLKSNTSSTTSTSSFFAEKRRQQQQRQQYQQQQQEQQQQQQQQQQEPQPQHQEAADQPDNTAGRTTSRHLAHVRRNHLRSVSKNVQASKPDTAKQEEIPLARPKPSHLPQQQSQDHLSQERQSQEQQPQPQERLRKWQRPRSSEHEAASGSITSRFHDSLTKAFPAAEKSTPSTSSESAESQQPTVTSPRSVPVTSRRSFQRAQSPPLSSTRNHRTSLRSFSKKINSDENVIETQGKVLSGASHQSTHTDGKKDDNEEDCELLERKENITMNQVTQDISTMSTDTTSTNIPTQRVEATHGPVNFFSGAFKGVSNSQEESSNIVSPVSYAPESLSEPVSATGVPNNMQKETNNESRPLGDVTALKKYHGGFKGVSNIQEESNSTVSPVSSAPEQASEPAPVTTVRSKIHKEMDNESNSFGDVTAQSSSQFRHISPGRFNGDDNQMSSFGSDRWQESASSPVVENQYDEEQTADSDQEYQEEEEKKSDEEDFEDADEQPPPPPPEVDDMTSVESERDYHRSLCSPASQSMSDPSPSKTLAQMAIDSVIIAGQYQDRANLFEEGVIDEDATEESYLGEGAIPGLGSESGSKDYDEKNNGRGTLGMSPRSRGKSRNNEVKTLEEGRVVIDSSELPSVANRAKLFGGSTATPQPPTPDRRTASPNPLARRSPSPLPPRAASPNHVNTPSSLPRAASPGPRSSFLVPRSASPAPRAMSPAPRSVPRSASPVPRASSPAPRPGTPPLSSSSSTAASTSAYRSSWILRDSTKVRRPSSPSAGSTASLPVGVQTRSNGVRPACGNSVSGETMSAASAPNGTSGAMSSMLHRFLSMNAGEESNLGTGSEAQQYRFPKSPSASLGGENRYRPPTPPRPFARTSPMAIVPSSKNSSTSNPLPRSPRGTRKNNSSRALSPGSSVIFGDPTTFGAAGGDGLDESPSIAVRARGIEEWSATKHVPATSIVCRDVSNEFTHENESVTSKSSADQAKRYHEAVAVQVADGIDRDTPEEQESSGIVFGDPTTFGTAGGEGVPKEAPRILDRARAIAEWPRNSMPNHKPSAALTPGSSKPEHVPRRPDQNGLPNRLVATSASSTRDFKHLPSGPSQIESPGMDTASEVSSVVFGDPSTFGAAGGDGDPVVAPRIIDRAKAIEGWNGGKGGTPVRKQANVQQIIHQEIYGEQEEEMDYTSTQQEMYGEEEKEADLIQQENYAEEEEVDIVRQEIYEEEEEEDCQEVVEETNLDQHEVHQEAEEAAYLRESPSSPYDEDDETRSDFITESSLAHHVLPDEPQHYRGTPRVATTSPASPPFLTWEEEGGGSYDDMEPEIPMRSEYVQNMVPSHDSNNPSLTYTSHSEEDYGRKATTPATHSSMNATADWGQEDEVETYDDEKMYSENATHFSTYDSEGRDWGEDDGENVYGGAHISGVDYESGEQPPESAPPPSGWDYGTNDHPPESAPSSTKNTAFSTWGEEDDDERNYNYGESPIPTSRAVVSSHDFEHTWADEIQEEDNYDEPSSFIPNPPPPPKSQQQHRSEKPGRRHQTMHSHADSWGAPIDPDERISFEDDPSSAFDTDFSTSFFADTNRNGGGKEVDDMFDISPKKGQSTSFFPDSFASADKGNTQSKHPKRRERGSRTIPQPTKASFGDTDHHSQRASSPLLSRQGRSHAPIQQAPMVDRGLADAENWSNDVDWDVTAASKFFEV